MHVFSLAAASRGYFLVVVRRLLVAVASLVVRRLSCPAASGVFPEQVESPALVGGFLTTGPPGKLKEGTFELNAERRVCVH